jgi:hypothetical protein
MPIESVFLGGFEQSGGFSMASLVDTPLTFNHGVEGSSPSALTNENNNLDGVFASLDPYSLASCTQAVHPRGLFDDTDTIGLFVFLACLCCAADCDMA